MSKADLGRVRGSLWYTGVGITGTSTAPKVFPDSGVDMAYIQDLFLGLEGRVYKCVKAGGPSVAEWIFVGSILGPQPPVVNNLDSTSTVKALSAKMGKELNDKINAAGVYPYEIFPSYVDKSYTLSLTIEDKTTAVTITDKDGNTGVFSYESEGLNAQATITITIGPDIGFESFGAIVSSVKSSNAAILSYKLYDVSASEVENVSMNLWEKMYETMNSVSRSTSFEENEKTYFTGKLKALVNGVLEQVYAIAHAKSTYWSIEDNKTVYDKVTEVEQSILTVVDEQVRPLATRVKGLETPTFETGDTDSPSGFITEAAMSGEGETMLTLLKKISTAVGNTKYLNGKLGSEDISEIGDGTVTGAVAGLNSNLGNYAFKTIIDEKGKKQKQVSDDGGETWENFNQGGEPVLLWSNPSPTQAFAQQTINESSSGWVSGESIADYDYFLIITKWYTTVNYKTINTVQKNVTSLLSSASKDSIDAGTQIGRRVVTSSDTGVVIGTGYNNTNGGDNQACIPVEIRGCKAMGEVPLKEPFGFAMGQFTAEIGKKYRVYLVIANDNQYPNLLFRTISGFNWIEEPQVVLQGGIYYNTYQRLLVGVLEATDTTVKILTGRGTDANIIMYAETE